MPPNGTRARILLALDADPGATTADVARCVGVDHATATYHLRRLAGEGFAGTLRHGGRLHHFAARVPPSERMARLGRRDRRAAMVLARLGTQPLALGAVAAGLPMGKGGVLWHLQRLSDLGLVAIEGPPRRRRYRATTPGTAPMVSSPQPGHAAG
jgi:predicted transcriptional regulator